MPTVADIATLLNVPVRGGDASRQVKGIATLTDAGPSDVTFLSSDEYLEQFKSTRAAAVIVDRSVKLDGHAPSGASLIVVEDSDLALAEALPLFAPPIPVPPPGIDPSARVAASAKLGDGHRVGQFVTIGERTSIGRNATIHPGTYIGDDVVMGDDCQVFHNVTIRERVTIGHRVILHAGCAIGSDGFGFKWSPKLKQHVKIPHIGTVIIEDDVEIGSCSCVDRAKFAATRVGRGSKLDNLVQIGHNAVLGPLCLLAGQVGVGGSTKLGAGVIVGGQAAFRDHINVGDGTRIASCAAIFQDTEPGAVVSGAPAFEHTSSLRSQAALRRLPDLVKKVRELEHEFKASQSRQDK